MSGYFAPRGLHKSPGFAAAAILVLAVGSAANVALATAQDSGGTREGEIEFPVRPVVLTTNFTASTASLSGAAPVVLSRRSLPDDNITVEFEVAIGPKG